MEAEPDERPVEVNQSGLSTWLSVGVAEGMIPTMAYQFPGDGHYCQARS